MSDPAVPPPPPVYREFPGPFPPKEHQGFEMDEDFARVEIVYPNQGIVVVRWFSDRRIETMRFGGPDLPPGTPVE